MHKLEGGKKYKRPDASGKIFFLHILYITFFKIQYSEEDRNKTDEEKNQDGLVRGIGTDGM